MNEMLQAALSYAEKGWQVHPLKPRGKEPLTKWLATATTDPEVIERFWSRWPGANIGLRTGINFDVLDVDHPDAAANLEPVDGPTVDTEKGRHVYVEPTGAGNKTGLLPHVDWRGVNGYVVAPPSVHPSGSIYRWDATRGRDWPLSPVGPWLAELLGAPKANSTQYGKAALEGELANVRGSSEGCRNEVLNIAAFNLGQLIVKGDLDEAEVVLALDSAAAETGLPPAEIARTISRGIRDGKAKPRTLGPRTDRVAEIMALADRPEAAQASTGLKVNLLLGRPGLVHRFTREVADPPSFGIHGDKGVGHLSSLQLSRPDALRGRIAEATGAWIEALPAGIKWPAISSALMEDVEEVDIGDAATDAGRGRAWIEDFLDWHKPYDDDQLGISSFLKNGRTYVVG